MSYSVAQNTTFLTVASIFQKVISFVYFTIIARLVGVENTGQYFFAIAFTTIFIVVADFGLGLVLTRETARYPEKTDKYLNTVFWTKVIFGLITYLLVVFFVNILRYPTETRLLVYFSGITMFFDNLHGVFYGVFRARKNLIFESIGVVGSQFTTLIVGSLALFLRWPLYWLILAYTIPSILNFLFSGYFLRRVYGLRYGFIWDKIIFRYFLAMALPFALAGIINRLYSYSDTMIMSKMLSAQEMGWWSVPYKITFAFQFVPIALSASVYPVMSSLYLENKEKINELFAKSWRYLFTIIFPLSFGLLAIAKPVILKLYGFDYLPSVPVLKILLISLIFGYLSFITGALLNATNHQKIQTTILGAALTVNVILNLIFIPRFGINGAAAAALFSNIILCVGGFNYARRFTVINGLNIFKFANQSFWPALIMSVAVYFIAQKINFILAIPVGIAIYTLLLFMTGGISRELINEAINKVWKKGRPKII